MVRRIAGAKRMTLKSFFETNGSTLPAEVHREDLKNVDPDWKPLICKNHDADQQLTAKTRKETDLVGILHVGPPFSSVAR